MFRTKEVLEKRRKEAENTKERGHGSLKGSVRGSKQA